MSMQALLNSLVGKDIQVKFKHEIQPQPLGPGKLDRITLTGNGGVIEYVYVLRVPAAAPTGQYTKPVMFVMPIVFAADAVLWISEGPLDEEGNPAVITPANGGKTPGGLHIPGR